MHQLTSPITSFITYRNSIDIIGITLVIAAVTIKIVTISCIYTTTPAGMIIVLKMQHIGDRILNLIELTINTADTTIISSDDPFKTNQNAIVAIIGTLQQYE